LGATLSRQTIRVRMHCEKGWGGGGLGGGGEALRGGERAQTARKKPPLSQAESLGTGERTAEGKKRPKEKMVGTGKRVTLKGRGLTRNLPRAESHNGPIVGG